MICYIWATEKGLHLGLIYCTPVLGLGHNYGCFGKPSDISRIVRREILPYGYELKIGIRPDSEEPYEIEAPLPERVQRHYKEPSVTASL